jgi:glycosyltransferase involved in cell wall biosynthesis
MSIDYLFVIPVYNDWESLYHLQKRTEELISPETKMQFLVIDDSSEEPCPADRFADLRSTILILELSRNMGHQKAIAAGLSYAQDHIQPRKLIVMDSDGEDRPEDLPALLLRSSGYKGIVFAKRSKRSEGWVFLQFYRLYQLLFVILTGKKINFGNYCLIPHQYLRKLVHVPDIWNHFSGGIIRSGIPYTSFPTERGKRYFGESKMNYTRLILHGLSSISVYADLMAIRLIIFSVILIILTLAGILVVSFIRLFTQLAIPGWATLTVISLGIILFLALLLGLILLFNVLAMKTQKNIIPARDYADFIYNVQIINAHG